MVFVCVWNLCYKLLQFYLVMHSKFATQICTLLCTAQFINLQTAAQNVSINLIPGSNSHTFWMASSWRCWIISFSSWNRVSRSLVLNSTSLSTWAASSVNLDDPVNKWVQNRKYSFFLYWIKLLYPRSNRDRIATETCLYYTLLLL